MRVMLIAFSCLLASAGSLTAQEDPSSGISVTGEGIVKVKPDRVNIKVRVENKGDSATEVKDKTDKTVQKVLKFLKDQKISEKDYKTDYINLDKRYDYNTKETHYTAQQAISIKLKDIQKYNSLMSGLMKSGINRIDGISFEDSQEEKHRKEARQKAAKNAYEKAKDYAEALNLKVGIAKRINEMGSNVPIVRPLMAKSARVAMDSESGNNETPNLAVGQIEIKEKVEVQFFLMKK